MSDGGIDWSDIDWEKGSDEELKALDYAFSRLLENTEAILYDESNGNTDHPDYIQARANLLATTGAFVDAIRAERARRKDGE